MNARFVFLPLLTPNFRSNAQSLESVLTQLNSLNRSLEGIIEVGIDIFRQYQPSPLPFTLGRFTFPPGQSSPFPQPEIPFGFEH